MTSDFVALYQHSVLHEFGHVVNYHELNTGTRNRLGWFFPADNEKGWPASNDLDGWADLFHGDLRDNGARQATMNALRSYDRGADELIADCVAQGLMPSVLGGYWLRDVAGNATGCPSPGALAAARYANGGVR
jgi:hypothetical protein